MSAHKVLENRSNEYGWTCGCHGCRRKGYHTHTNSYLHKSQLPKQPGRPPGRPRVLKDRIPLTPPPKLNSFVPPPKRMPPPTLARLKELLDYDPQTGIFTWKMAESKRIKVGCRAGCKDSYSGYWVIYIDRKRYYGHRLAWFWVHGQWPTVLDHKNRDPSDNRISNLRKASPGQSRANTKIHKNNSSKFKGVRQSGRGWAAIIRCNGKKIYLGTFATPEEAHSIYCKAGQRLYGNFFCPR